MSDNNASDTIIRSELRNSSPGLKPRPHGAGNYRVPEIIGCRALSGAGNYRAQCDQGLR